MREAFVAIALLILVSAAAALTLRNLVRSVLLFTASWAGIGAFYLWAGAEFAAFAQILVYVGAISMVALFAVLLTRSSAEADAESKEAGSRPPLQVPPGPLIVATMTGSVLLVAVWMTPLASRPSAAPVHAPDVRDLGMQLMNDHPVALLAVGALLTVALLGAVVIASADKAGRGEDSR